MAKSKRFKDEYENKKLQADLRIIEQVAERHRNCERANEVLRKNNALKEGKR